MAAKEKNTTAGPNIQKAFAFQITNVEYVPEGLFGFRNTLIVQNRQEALPVLSKLKPLSKCYFLPKINGFWTISFS